MEDEAARQSFEKGPSQDLSSQVW